jgi:hypothetical protein
LLRLHDAEIRTQIHSDVRAAWPDVQNIHGAPPILDKGKGDYPYAVVHLERFTNEPSGGSRDVDQTLEYTIAYVGRLGGSTPVEAQKVALADALMDQLLAEHSYAGVANDRHVTEGDFGTPNDVDEECYGFTLRFVVVVDAAE